jgi:hypothetical protein
MPSSSEIERLAKREQLWAIFPHSSGFSGGQLPSYVEDSLGLDFPWLHDALSQDKP